MRSGGAGEQALTGSEERKSRNTVLRRLRVDDRGSRLPVWFPVAFPDWLPVEPHDPPAIIRSGWSGRVAGVGAKFGECFLVPHARSLKTVAVAAPQAVVPEQVLGRGPRSRARICSRAGRRHGFGRRHTLTSRSAVLDVSNATLSRAGRKLTLWRHQVVIRYRKRSDNAPGGAHPGPTACRRCSSSRPRARSCC
jgi:hypothetical protein